MLPINKTSKIALLILCGLTLLFCKIFSLMGNYTISPQIYVLEQRRASESIVIGVLPPKKIKTTCFTGIECPNAIKQNLKVGQVAMAGVPFGTKVKVIETGLIYEVATRPDNKTDFDIFYGDSYEAYQRCLERGVKYYTIEIL